MKFVFDSSFRYAFKKVSPPQDIEVRRKLDAFIRAFEIGKVPDGFGLKLLSKNVWEIRLNLPQRVLFFKEPGCIVFTFIGSHDEVHRFLKHR